MTDLRHREREERHGGAESRGVIVQRNACRRMLFKQHIFADEIGGERDKRHKKSLIGDGKAHTARKNALF